MESIIINNASYWLKQLQQHSGTQLSNADLERATSALETVSAIPAAWELTLGLITALHSLMEQRGYWNDWKYFLKYILDEAQTRDDKAATIVILSRQGMIQQQQGNVSAAIAAHRRAGKLSLEIGDVHSQAVAYSNLGYLYRRQKQFNRAKALCGKAIMLFTDLDDTLRRAYTHNNLGLVYLDQQLWSAALPQFCQARDLFEQIGDLCGLAMTLKNLGILCYNNGQNMEALELYKKALHYYQQMDNAVEVARTRLTLSNIYVRQNKPFAAELICLEAESTLKRLGDALNAARAQHNLGRIYSACKDWPKAAACFQCACDYWLEIEDNLNLAHTDGEMSAMYIAKGALPQARKYLAEAWALLPDPPEIADHDIRHELTQLQQKLDSIT